VAEIRGAYAPEFLPPWLPQLVGTTKEPPTTGKGAPPTTEEDDDDDEDIEGVPPVDAGTVANTKVVGAGGAVSPRVVGGGGGSVMVDGGGQGGGKQPPVKQAPPEPLVEPAKPIPVKITKAPKEYAYEFSKARLVVKERIVEAQPHDPNMVQLPGGGWGTREDSERSDDCSIITGSTNSHRRQVGGCSG
jgi:hypothetical protein